MLLLLGVVVVAVDLLLPIHRDAEPLLDTGDQPIHHLRTVEQGVGLRPAHLPDVGPELVGAFHEVGKIFVRQGNPPPLAEHLRDADVVLGDLVADTPRARMQEQPDPTRLVPGDLDEVIAGPERAELEIPVSEETRGIELGALGGARQRRDPVMGVRARDCLVAGAGGERNCPLDRLAHRPPVRGQVCLGQLGPHGDHPAADVDADGCRNHGPQGGNDGPDGRAEAQVGIGHQCQVRVDERQARGLLGLGAGLRVEDAGPVEQLGLELLHDALLSMRCALW